MMKILTRRVLVPVGAAVLRVREAAVSAAARGPSQIDSPNFEAGRYILKTLDSGVTPSNTQH